MRGDRISGWFNVREWLRVFERNGKKESRLKIFDDCKELIRCLPMVQFEKDETEDVAKEPHELTHVVDALRYFCVWRPIAHDYGEQLGRNLEEEEEEDGLDDFYSFGG